MRSRIAVEKKNKNAMLSHLHHSVCWRERGDTAKKEKGEKRKLLFLNLFISHCQKSFCVTSGVSQENRNSEGILVHLIYTVNYARQISLETDGLRLQLRSRTFP